MDCQPINPRPAPPGCGESEEKLRPHAHTTSEPRKKFSYVQSQEARGRSVSSQNPSQSPFHGSPLGGAAPYLAKLKTSEELQIVGDMIPTSKWGH